MKLAPVAISVLALAALGPRTAGAQADDLMAQIGQLNNQAIAAYEGYAYKKGRKALYKALRLARTKNLHKDPRLAPTFVLLGVGAIAGSSDLYRGLHFFVRGLRLNRKIGLPRKLLTPQIIQVYKSAKKAVRAIGKPPKVRLVRQRRKTKRQLTTVRKDARGLVHQPIDEAKKGYPIPVKAARGADIRASHFFLFYRSAGKVKYKRLTMRRSRGAYRAAIPAKATYGRYVHYYIEARDQRGRRAASHGSERGPNVVITK